MKSELAPSSDGPARLIEEVRARYDGGHRSHQLGAFGEHDWRRCQEALARVRGPDVLLLGVGAGQMYDVLARLPSIGRLIGFDEVRDERLVPGDRGELELGSFLRLPHPDRSFDTVVCLDVLHHVAAIATAKVLHEARRVCRGTLVATVPYEGTEPLARRAEPGRGAAALPQRFTEETIDRWFPLAERTLIPRGEATSPWLLLVERQAP